MSFLTNEWLNKKTLIHETLHLWWGDNSIRFENPVFTEAITEFLTLDYLKKIKEDNYLKKQLSFKKRNVKNIKAYNLNFDDIKSKKAKKLIKLIVMIYYHCFCGQEMKKSMFLKN